MTTKQSQEIRFATSADGTSIAYACAGAGPILVRAGLWMGHLEQDWKSPIRKPYSTKCAAPTPSAGMTRVVVACLTAM